MARKQGQGQGESSTSPRRLTAAERQDEAFAMRKAGATLQEIADAVGYANRSGALKAIEAALRKLPPPPQLEEHRKLEWERLDAMQAALWPKVLEGDPESCRVVIRVMERRAKMLGSDALPSLNAVSNDVVQGVLDSLIGLAVRMLGAEQRQSFLAQVETTLLQITDGSERT